MREISELTYENIVAAADAARQKRAHDMPTEQDALKSMFSAWQRLCELGFRSIDYCPRDGTPFEAIEAGSTGIFHAHYSGVWPDGHWWVEDGGDIWPSRPIMFRPLPASKSDGGR